MEEIYVSNKNRVALKSQIILIIIININPQPNVT